MVNYQLGKIYKIVCNKTGLIYVGSTCEPTLARRLAKHKGSYNYYLNHQQEKNRYMTSFKIIENDDCDIVLIENCPCENKDELHKRERYYIESLDCVNKVIVGQTDKEYREQNKAKNKEWRNNHKEALKLTKSDYYFKNKEEINKQHKEYYEANKEAIIKRTKEYSETKKDAINKRNREYHEAHKEEINKRRRELRALKKQQQTDI